MTPKEAKKWFGAQYYLPKKDGKTPQLYYRIENIKYNDGTNKDVLEYLSFANIWFHSRMEKSSMHKLIKIYQNG